MSDPFVIGLTGSIGMGKTTTARMFAGRGVPVWSADDAVHRLYAPGGAAVTPLSAACPDALTQSGGIDRTALKTWIASDENALRAIEAIVHPLVAQDRQAFISTAKSGVIVLDIPLLFETGMDAHVDLVVVVSTDGKTQRERVLARPGMTEAQLDLILSKQVPDAEKRARADVVIDTSAMASAEDGVSEVLRQVEQQLESGNA